MSELALGISSGTADIIAFSIVALWGLLVLGAVLFLLTRR